MAAIEDVLPSPVGSVEASFLAGGPTTPRTEAAREGSPRRRVTDREHATVLVCVDFLATCAAVPLALLLLAAVSSVPANSLGHFDANAASDSLFPLAVVVALMASGSYRATRRALQPSTFTELKDLAFAVGAGCILLLVVSAVAHATLTMPELSSTQLITAVVVASVLVPVGRAAVRAWIQTFTVTRVLVVGSGALAGRLAIHLRLHKGMEMVGRVVGSAEMEPGALGTIVDLPRICEELDVDRIIISADQNGPEAIAAYRAVQERVRIAVVPRHYELISWRAKLTELSGLPMLEFAPPHMSMWDRGTKRALDIVISIVALILLSPVLLSVALIVRCTSKGPVLFRQQRLGRGRRPFVINKFRTMTGVRVAARPRTPPGCEPAGGAEACGAPPLWKARNKTAEVARITPVGSFLRRTGLDELPQLVNVVAGHMAIVGPRPFVPDESDETDDWKARRFEVRPGITGLWQVSGRNELNAEDLRQLDYLYVVSWSMSWDMKIIFDTPRAMVRGLGAY